MTYLGFLLALLFFATTIYLYRKAEQAKDRLHETEKELARKSSTAELADRFKVLSAEVLDQQEAKASKALDAMLRPMREQVGDFQAKVEKFVAESRETKTILDEKFKNLDVNVQNLGDEAQQLTEVLRGSSKTRGDWGEMVLKKALELAGLREGDNFQLQKGYATEDGRVITDVVVLLPEGRDFVIDAKVPLVAYDEYVNAADESAAAAAAQRFGEDAKKMALEVTKYLAIPELNTPGFAMMFIPIEPAWELLSRLHPKVIQEAYAKGVIIVGPTTLLAALKMIEQMWRNEKSVRSVGEIIARANQLMEAVELLVDRVGKSRKYLERAVKEFGSIDTSIHGQKGVVFHATKLKEYGVKGKGTLPEPSASFDELPATAPEGNLEHKENEKIAD